MGREVDRRKDLGGSLPVENVQALASKNLKDVPSRYIRPQVQFDEVSIDESLHIPVIDMSKLVADQLGQQDELAKLHLACKEWGFFLVQSLPILFNLIHYRFISFWLCLWRLTQFDESYCDGWSSWSIMGYLEKP